MGCIKSGTLPTARVTKGFYLRLRVDGRVFNLGKVGSKIADERPMKTLALFCLLALPTFAADTIIVGKVVGVHDGDTL